jgi:hypothetical protein
MLITILAKRTIKTNDIEEQKSEQQIKPEGDR